MSYLHKNNHSVHQLIKTTESIDTIPFITEAPNQAEPVELDAFAYIAVPLDAVPLGAVPFAAVPFAAVPFTAVALDAV